MRICRWTKVCEEVVAFNLSGGLRPVRKDASYAITVHNLGVERIPANFIRLFAQGLASQNFVDSVVREDLGDTEEVVAFNLSGGLRPVRKDASYAITVHNLGVERIPANFIRLFAQGLASQNFVDSVVREDLGDTEEVALKGFEEVDLVSSDVSTVYRSPSPPSPGVDSFEHDLRFALGPAIFSRTEQEERLYSVQIPDSPPAVSPAHESSSSSTDDSLHFDSTDVPVHAQAEPHAPTTVDSTKLAEILEDLQSSLAQRIHDSNCEMISKLNSVELGVRGDLLKMQSLLRQSFETACRVLERQSNTHTAQITDLKKGLLGPVGIIFGDLIEIKKKQTRARCQAAING
ncbi:hypothetical protein F511_09270 [Dorcoceras hygrometricum]|uniref:Uncharacterized protein n=1 Tax=Dorcoceras hygrometricum TaxID=472368 RepID=A0A2Z7BJH7_9LAMI|nr:hypothetical protein F511_09270 [Dorcoceras hygrometricum]